MTSAVPFPSYYHGVTNISNFPCYEGDVVITIMLFITDCGIKRGAGAGGGGHGEHADDGKHASSMRRVRRWLLEPC